MKITQNRVIIHKNFNLPVAEGVTPAYPTQMSTSNTFEFTVRAPEGGHLTVYGTVANVDANAGVITLNPQWTATGPIFEAIDVKLEDIEKSVQLFVSMTQDTNYQRVPAAVQYTFTINGHQIDADDQHFMKIACVPEPNATNRKGEPKKQNAIYGYIMDVVDDTVIVDAMEFVRGDVHHFTAHIDLDDLIGIFRYKVELSEFVHHDRSKKSEQPDNAQAAD